MNGIPGQISDEVHFRVLRLIEKHPELTQRELATELAVSVGKVNYLLKALIGKGLVKARNFKNSRNKSAYAYILTSAGLEEKARVTVRFVKRKTDEYEALRREIEELQRDMRRQSSGMAIG